MNKKIIIPLIIIIIAAVIFIMAGKKEKGISETEKNISNTSNDLNKDLNTDNNKQIKEFSTDSFVEFIDGKPNPQFSLKEITVNKADIVIIKIKTISGKHDFKIDEFNVYAETPIGEETMVEFMVDKVGEFIYYCSQPGHRENGHWGTLNVID